MAGKKIGLILGDGEKVEGRYGDNMNALIIAPPGGGKTYGVVSPNIEKNGGCSMFIDDKKGSLYHKHKDKLLEEGYKVYCFNLINFFGDFHYNPFSGVKSRDDIHKIVQHLIPDEKKGSDPYWLDSSRELAEALIEIYLAANDGITLKKLINFLHQTGTTFKNSYRAAIPEEDAVDKVIAILRANGMELPGMQRYQSLRQNAPETWKCVRSSCISALSAFDSDRLFSVTDKTTMEFAEMGKEKVAIFVTSSDINGAYAPIVQLMYRDIVEKLMEFADNECIENNSMLPRHVRFMLDDFASGTLMPGFERIIANCRSRNISFLICIQSLTQLKGLYKEMADSILDCINYRVYFSSTNLVTQQYLSLILNLPLSDIQEMGKEDICLERINHVPKLAKRYRADRLYANSQARIR